MEIERKFLLTPAAEQELMSIPAPFTIIQMYINFVPEVRIRERICHATGEHSYRLAIKSKGNLSRFELQRELTGYEYYQLGKMRQGFVIEKQYHPDFYGFQASIAAISDRRITFCYAEKEFQSEDDAMLFKMDDFPILARDITNESEWKMLVIARNGGVPR
jgi:CYTH domain-containing protein